MNDVISRDEEGTKKYQKKRNKVCHAAMYFLLSNPCKVSGGVANLSIYLPNDDDDD